jgi:hypothetical protein
MQDYFWYVIHARRNRPQILLQDYTLRGRTYRFIYIYKRLRPRKKIRNRKKERATETLNLKLNTKPLKLKCGLAGARGGGRAG